jgi:hypothetical protein
MATALTRFRVSLPPPILPFPPPALLVLRSPFHNYSWVCLRWNFSWRWVLGATKEVVCGKISKIHRFNTNVVIFNFGGKDARSCSSVSVHHNFFPKKKRLPGRLEGLLRMCGIYVKCITRKNGSFLNFPKNM